jgi:hypothetical protein
MHVPDIVSMMREPEIASKLHCSRVVLGYVDHETVTVAREADGLVERCADARFTLLDNASL